MISTPARGASRGPGESDPPLRALAGGPAIVVLLLGGLVLRLTIAYVLFPASGFETDLASYASWALSMAQHGAPDFYANAGFVDYPPAYLLLLWPVGLAAQASSPDAYSAALDLVKLPPMLLDLGVAYLLYRLALGWSWPGRRAERVALAAAALYLLNPVTLYDSALWGQTDAAGALVLLLGVAALIRGNPEGATGLAVLAALVKPQFGVVLIPLVGVVLLKRHLLRPGTAPRHDPRAPAALGRWLAGHQGPSRILTSLLVGLVTFHVLALPFGMGIPEYLDLTARTAGGYAYLSVNAYNLWALVGSGSTPALATSLLWSADTLPLLGPLPGVVIGGLLLAAGFLWAIGRAAARDDRWTLLVAAAVLSMVFFVLPTRVHERYVFPALAFLPLLAAVERRWRVALLLLGAGVFINLHGVLTNPLYGTANVETLPLGDVSRTAPLIALSAILQTAVAAWAAWRLRSAVISAPDSFERVALDGCASTAPRAPAHDGRARGSGALGWLAAKVSLPPLRRDRSAELAAEGPGRLDRLDLLLVVLLVIGSTTLRGYRLDEPFDMYFDEVYHARTATEFLQHWRYDQPHDIYEYTHPHLAKYLMAAGIALAGGNQVRGTSQLGTMVVDAALERRWAPFDDPGARFGDRLFVASGSQLRVFDLGSRQPEVTLDAPATALAVDSVEHRLYVADTSGSLLALDTTRLDERRSRGGQPPSPEAVARLPSAPVERLVVTDVSVVAISANDRLVAVDIDSGDRSGSARVAGAVDAVALPAVDRIVADTARIGDPKVAALVISEILGQEPERMERRLRADARTVVLAAYLDDATRDELEARIEEGTLPGASIEQGPLLAVSGEAGITVLDALTLDELDLVRLDGAPPTGLALVPDGFDEPRLYAAAGTELWVGRAGRQGISTQTVVEMPAAVTRPLWNDAAKLVHVIGERPPARLTEAAAESRLTGGDTIYVVEPNGHAVFADVELPHPAGVAVVDTQAERPTLDRGQILVLSTDGSVTAVGIEGNAFGWRLPGVLMGALTAASLYLLARMLFRRRSVAVIAGLLALAEGMLFANARIAMNDVYVTGFLLAAVTLFVPLYLGRVARRPSVALALVGMGLFLGLALASKWVALYAMGGLLLLLLLRSALGRLLALGGMLLLTAFLGAMAITPADVEQPSRNWLFLLVMLGLTGVLAAGIVRRPVRLSREELWFATVAPLAMGASLLAAAVAVGADTRENDLLSPERLVLVSIALLALGPLIALAARLAARRGRGPLAPGAPLVALGGPLPAPPPSGWLRPGWRLGLPWLFALACLGLLPLAVYVVSYAPWVALGNQWLAGLPAGHDGQTLLELTRSMYDYHDNLRASHAAASPWWAWPLDLKPVWFYQEGFAGGTTGLIYDSGNLVLFWMGIPGLGFAAWAAWRRRSLALTVVLISFAALWLPWARIDRATFQYHIYASLPFMLLALAYFLAELWHGPGRRTWLLARAAAALAILAAPLMWLLRTPVCVIAGTQSANPGGAACSSIERTATLSEGAIVSLLVLAAGAATAAWFVWQASPRSAGRQAASDRYLGRAAPLPGLLLVTLVTLVGVLVANVTLSTQAAFSLSVTAEQLALVAVVVLSVPAGMALRARDARRFAVGVVGAAGIWLLIWYPNLSGLPLPASMAYVYQGLLPTWNYDFQFAVNLDPASSVGVLDVSTLVVAVVAVSLVAGVVFVARAWGADANGVTDRVVGST